MYDHTTVRPYKVLLATCVANCTTGTPTPRLCPVVQWSVHWAPCRTTWARRWKKKMQALLLGLAKSIYYLTTMWLPETQWHISCTRECATQILEKRVFSKDWGIKMPSKTMQYISISKSYPIYFFIKKIRNKLTLKSHLNIAFTFSI